jgi:putative sterol carrier protein
LALLPADRNLRSFYLYLTEDEETQAFTFVLDGPRRVVEGEAAPAAFGLFIHQLDLKDLVEGFGDVRAMMVDGRLRIEGDLGAGLSFVEVLAGLAVPN